MGLNTSHGCWDGAYSAFMRWRCHLHAALSGETFGHESLMNAWNRGDYDDQRIPMNVLMNHSDCDGKIPHEMCGPIADKLEELLPRLPDEDAGGHVGNVRNKTQIFINGLRKADAAGESVEFH